MTMEMETQEENVVDTLLSYRKLSEDCKNHPQLLKDKTIILYSAILLENKNMEVVNLCLDIFTNFIENEKTHYTLLNTFGIFEALESLAISARNYDNKISDRASKLTELLRKTAPPAYSTRSRKNIGRNTQSTTSLYHLYIPDLTLLSRSLLDETLVAIKGIISFVVDVQNQRCAIRVSQKVTIKSIIVKILENTEMNALLIAKDPKSGTEKFVDILNESNKTLPLDYHHDDNTATTDGAVYYFTNTWTKNASNLLKSAADMWNKSFYW